MYDTNKLTCVILHELELENWSLTSQVKWNGIKAVLWFMPQINNKKASVLMIRSHYTHPNVPVQTPDICVMTHELLLCETLLLVRWRTIHLLHWLSHCGITFYVTAATGRLCSLLHSWAHSHPPKKKNLPCHHTEMTKEVFYNKHCQPDLQKATSLSVRWNQQHQPDHCVTKMKKIENDLNYAAALVSMI